MLKPLMTEEQKAADRVPIDELAFDFSCRVTRMYKWLNEGKLSKADRDIVGPMDCKCCARLLP